MQLQLYGKEIWVFRKSVDFRFSLNGLSSLVAVEMKRNPQEGIYIFYNKRRDRIKCLSWHKNGFILLYKRLEREKFCFAFNKEQGAIEINSQELSWLFAGLEWQKMSKWSELSYDKFS